jgi:hypothetical protein
MSDPAAPPSGLAPSSAAASSGPTSSAPAIDTVEALIRAQLASALGGRRGVLEAAVPTAVFSLVWVITHQLPLSLGLGLGSAVALLVVRIVTRTSVQFVVNSLIGILIAAVFALRSGQAADAFLPGIVYNAGYAVILVGSVVARWPLVGVLVGAVTGDMTAWRSDRAVVTMTGRLTLVLAVPCVLRVLVEWPLYAAGQVGWLAVAKIGLGWPVQLAALAVMVALLARGRTPRLVEDAAA